MGRGWVGFDEGLGGVGEGLAFYASKRPFAKPHQRTPGASHIATSLRIDLQTPQSQRRESLVTKPSLQSHCERGGVRLCFEKRSLLLARFGLHLRAACLCLSPPPPPIVCLAGTHNPDVTPGLMRTECQASSSACNNPDHRRDLDLAGS